MLQVGQARTVVRRILSWYDDHARDLPWRRPDATPWAIMVSEFMLQQTPVERVRGPWQAWLERWPSPRHWQPLRRARRYALGVALAIHAGRSGCTKQRA